MARRFDADITRVAPAQLLAALARAWRVVFNVEPPPASLLVLLAQWSLETGDGFEMRAFNLGNIKAREGDGRDYCYFSTFEMVDGVRKWFRPDDPTCRFRAFATLDDGAVDYLKTLSHRFAHAWPAVIAGDPEEFARLLRAVTYYTADEHAYAAGLRARVERFRKLAPLPPPPSTPPLEDDERYTEATERYPDKPPSSKPKIA